jgi:calcineurin-like phosphoesterase family protein
MRIFGTSDHHFWHKNVIKVGERPFDSLAEMHEFMIARWNQEVLDQDLVIHCGDFVLGKRVLAKEILGRLNGRKVLVPGNHDHHTASQYTSFIGFMDVQSSLVLRLFGKKFIFRHEPFYEKPLGVDLVFHGHVHQNTTNLPWNVNVSVEATGYHPVELIPRILELCPGADESLDVPIFTSSSGEYLNTRFEGGPR